MSGRLEKRLEATLYGYTQEERYIPTIWRVMFPTMFSGFLQGDCPEFEPESSGCLTKHSTSVPFNSEVAMPLRLDVKKPGPVVPNPLPVLAMKGLPEPQGSGSFIVLCSKKHSLVPTRQTMASSLSPSTVQKKVKVSLGQVGRAAVKFPATSPGRRIKTIR